MLILRKDACVDRLERIECEVNRAENGGGMLHRWPSDDPDRGKVLEKIQSMFSYMIKHQCLSTRHVRKLLEFANEQIKALSLPSNIFSVCGEELERGLVRKTTSFMSSKNTAGSRKGAIRITIVSRDVLLLRRSSQISLDLNDD